MKVVIPVDGSESSLYAIQTAARFLDKANSEVYLFTVRVPMVSEVPWALTDEGETGRILEQARMAASEAGLQVEKMEYSTFHEPASAICKYADEIMADLIMIGSHGHQGLTRLLMGSVSEQVFKRAKQPVVIVRNDKTHSVAISHFEEVALQKTPTAFVSTE